jgi:hypothetical protein
MYQPVSLQCFSGHVISTLERASGNCDRSFSSTYIAYVSAYSIVHNLLSCGASYSISTTEDSGGWDSVVGNWTVDSQTGLQELCYINISNVDSGWQIQLIAADNFKSFAFRILK